ncbi:hypothetical protein M407DRAFT_21508 [Tulasnella calospora MUT 4182]|uniref:Uncharacterized protein n=1 Tax=Tulasnella calospora MUT 4182 TaxID=1051891 RepID=A0A0C3L6H7_9AGAM|nr:hypothetical protein M407DRAFT_21508 [Tulasnella calospora MUT 4182]
MIYLFTDVYWSYFKFVCGLDLNRRRLPTSSRPSNDDRLLLKFTSYVVNERNLPPLQRSSEEAYYHAASYSLGNSRREGVSLRSDDQEPQAQRPQVLVASFGPTPLLRIKAMNNRSN